MEQQSTYTFNPQKKWASLQESITLKLFVIGILVLILLIPATWIKSLIKERQSRAEGVMEEVAEKWSGRQTLSGPVLVLPFTAFEKINKGNGIVETIEKTDYAFFLPEELKVKGEVNPQTLHRGIFDAVVYTTELSTQATFAKPDLKSLNIAEEHVQWEHAAMIFGITDIGGISTTPVVRIGNRDLTAEPSANVGISIRDYKKDYTDEDEVRYTRLNAPAEFSSNGIVAKLNWQSSEDFNGQVSIKLNLRGSERLNFVPTGKATSVALNGPWADPSFDGEFLPEKREITPDGFTAAWNVLHFNRPFAQQWIGKGTQLASADFGLKLLVPVDQYQKSIRTSKYAQLIIILTFVALFLVEITQKIRIHPFQYILIGAALIIYYTLLLSISEQLGFSIAY